MKKAPTITDTELLREIRKEELRAEAEQDSRMKGLQELLPVRGRNEHRINALRSKNKGKLIGVTKTSPSAIANGGKPYRADIHYKGRPYYLGVFNSPEDAARAYDAAARKIWGDAAITNFPEEQQ